LNRSPIPLPALQAVPRARLHEIDDGSRLEWLETDGRGGYAAGTAVGANTRKYHGVLVVARRPPADRVVLLSRLEETLVLEDGRRAELAVNFYPGAVYPSGHLLLQSFALDPWPMWRYRIGDIDVLKELFVSRRAQATILRYQIRGGAATLELRPLVAGRDFHALITANGAVRLEAEVSERLVAYQPYDSAPPLVISFAEGEWQSSGGWYYQTVYPREMERGLNDREDLFCPGVLRVPLVPAAPTVIACGTRPARSANAALWVSEELKRRGRVAEAARTAGKDHPRLAEFAARLGLAADAFIVERGAGRSIIAGYPWFADWARDALISIPGLCLVNHRLDDAASVLRTFAANVRGGLLPNRFPDRGGSVTAEEYNAVDAPLWFVEAVARLRDAGGNIEEFWPVVKEILFAYERGTRFGIGLDSDGLIKHGERLTWMDARVDGRAVTPRAGKAVEINALWYNAVRRGATLAQSRTRAEHYGSLANRCRAGFQSFWYEQGGYLYDVIDSANRPDATLRPNQLLAVSLPHSPLDPVRARRVVDVVEHELLVPLAVRTLSPRDPNYMGALEGSLPRLDGAYHSGTAWPWLIGPFATAYLRVHGYELDACEKIEQLLLSFEAHLATFGLGHVAEVIAGDPPHTAGGCFAQAWSCAEVLRVIGELCTRLPGGTTAG
jgi:predicted glycogen debranching enzyme